MEKLLENLDKMIWKDIEKISDKELNETESELGIKFPKEDRKYIKTYNRGKAQNIYIDINGQKFNVDITTFKSKFYISNRDSFYQVTEEFFKNRNLMPIIWNMKFDAKNGEIKGIFSNLIMYDYTNNIKFPELVFITYYEKIKDDLKTVRLEYDFIKESVKEEKIGENLSDIFEYMYINDREIEMEKITDEFEETATKKEIKEFQEKINLKFPEKYEKLLNTAREEKVEIYPEKFKKKVPDRVIDTGYYIPLDEVKSTYEVFVEYHKPYPKKLIPIKECGGGDYICLDYRGKLNTTLKEPKITYYVHDEIGNRRFIHLADSYDKFLDMIEVDEEEIERKEKEIEESYFYGEQPLED